MKRPGAVLLLIAALALSASGQEASLLFNQANELYRSGDYRKASEAYQQIIGNGYESAPLYYNLGNCSFKLGDFPSAILAYERAKRLAPRDEDVLYNLRLANLRVVDKIEPIPQLFFVDWWNSLMNAYSADTWGIIGIAALWIAALSASVVLVIRLVPVRRIGGVLVLVCVLAAVLAFVGAAKRASLERSGVSAIIFSPSVSVKSAPDEQSTDLFVIHEGVKVELLDVVSNWRKIRLADGKVGWMPEVGLKII